MENNETLICRALEGCVRVNTSTRSVEIFSEHGVKHVLRNLDDDTYNAFASKYQNF